VQARMEVQLLRCQLRALLTGSDYVTTLTDRARGIGLSVLFPPLYTRPERLSKRPSKLPLPTITTPGPLKRASSGCLE
jgi:hypothetical protein